MNENVHASAVVVNGRGILILGKSGSGKSELALDLIDQCILRGVPAMLVGDDQLFVEVAGDAVIARVPDTIAGLIEVRGSGIHEIDCVKSAKIDLCVRLVESERALRMPKVEPQEVLPGIFLPCLELPKGSYSALRTVLARLGLYGGLKGLHES